MLTDHPAVEALQGDDDAMQQHHQQQLVRERGRRIKAAAELGLARSSSRGRRWGRALGRRVLTVLPKKDAAAAFVPAAAAQQPLVKEAARGDEQEEEDDEEGVAVDEKVALLRQLVPGGEDMEAEGLLEETADYIAALKAQVGVMRALACMLSGAGLDDALPPPGKADGHVITPEK